MSKADQPVEARADEAHTKLEYAAPRERVAAEQPVGGPDSPVIPSERGAWLGLVATLLACLALAIAFFVMTGAKGM